MPDKVEYRKCANGHLFDPKKTPTCPYCPKPARQTGPRQAAEPEEGSRRPGTVPEALPDGGRRPTVPEAASRPPAADVLIPANSERRPPATAILGESGTRPRPIFAWLVVLEGRQQYEVFRLEKEQSCLGTGDQADVYIDDEYASHEHASIRFRDGRFYITDLDSRNGTFVNGSEPQHRIDRVELHDSDEIRIGQAMMKFKCL